MKATTGIGLPHVVQGVVGQASWAMTGLAGVAGVAGDVGCAGRRVKGHIG